MKQSPADKKRKIETKHGPLTVGLKPRSLHFQCKNAEATSFTKETCPGDKSETKCNSETKSNSSREYSSPMSALERYVHNAQTKVDIERAKLEQMQRETGETVERIESARAAAGAADVKTCGNCHLRLGHSQKKCTLQKCTDVFSCRLEKRHPGQLNRRGLDQETSKQQKVVSEAEGELKRRTSCIQTAKIQN